MDCPRKYKKIYCFHCDKEVSKSTWYTHYGQYYDPRAGTWKKSTSTSESYVSADFNFDSDSETDDGVDYDSMDHGMDYDATIPPQTSVSN